MFNYQVRSQAELQPTYKLMEEGIYDYQVLKAESQISKAGQPMLKLTLKVWDNNGKEHVVFDYLLDNESFAYKINHFCNSLQLPYSGTIDNNVIGKTGSCRIGIKKDKTGKYPDQNCIWDYIADARPPAQTAVDAAFDDSLPF